MNPSYLAELEKSLTPQIDAEPTPLKSGVAILMQDNMNQRLVESAALHLDLKTVRLDPAHLDAADLSNLEIIVADQPFVAGVRELLQRRDPGAEGVNPAVIAVIAAGDILPQLNTGDHPHDGLLALPQPPAQLSAQLSLVLYSHRAFARRYQDALEELQLNRRIFRSVTSGISVANALLPDMPLTYVNPAFEAMTGYTLEEVMGKNCRFLQGDQNEQPGLTLIREAIRARREVTAVIRNFRKNGTPFWNELSLSPIRNRDGQVTHFVGIQTDVTARVEFEAALRESEKLAAVGRLASSIAHEINNPLESVTNLIYLAERAEAPALVRQYLATADQELRRVKLITTQSLRFFKQSTKPQAIGCTDLLNPVIDLYHSRLINARVKVSRRERSTHSIVCMESEIRQVLHNLVSNAIDAMVPQGGGRLVIRTRDTTEWRHNIPGITITIADTGMGIDPETLRNIYTAFYTTKGIGGTGLGLWISSEIVDRHHGRLLVRSRQQPHHSGTVFQLFLPLQGLGT